jgi:hypothetical protein
MMFAEDYPLLGAFWTMLIFFSFVIWIWLMFTVFADVFRRHDSSGFKKVLWIAFVVLVPYLGVFVYLLANHEGMSERSAHEAEQQKTQMDDYVRSVAATSSPSDQIATAKNLFDQGTISQAEFDQIKAKALA